MTEAEYYQAKSVLDSPNDYDGRMVTDARNYVRGYEDAESQLKAKMPSDRKCTDKYNELHDDSYDYVGWSNAIKWIKQQILKP